MNKLIRWILLGVGIFGILACSPVPVIEYDLGITRFCQTESGQIVIGKTSLIQFNFSDFSPKVTTEAIASVEADGSLRRISSVFGDICFFEDETYSVSRSPWTLETEHAKFYFSPSEGIYRILENGEKFEEIDLSFLNHEARLTYFNSLFLAGNRPYKVYSLGVWDSVYDATTDTLIVAMGLNGILRRSSDGNWNWIAVKNYTVTSMLSPLVTVRLLIVELLTMLLIIPLYRAIKGKADQILQSTGTLILLLIWVSITLIYRVSYEPYDTAQFIGVADGFVYLIVTIGFVFSYLVFLILPKFITLLRRGNRDDFKHLIALCGLYIAPYILWSWGIIPYHIVASALAVIATGIGLWQLSK